MSPRALDTTLAAPAGHEQSSIDARFVIRAASTVMRGLPLGDAAAPPSGP